MRAEGAVRRIETFEFWDELLALKDELSLRELAERFNVTPGAISAAFKRTATSRTPAPPGPRNLRVGHHARGQGREELAAEAALVPVRGSPRPGSKDGLLQEHASLLGRVPDSEIAERAGVSQRTVASYRARHDIPGYTGSPQRRDPAGARSAWRVVIRHEDGNEAEGVLVAPSLVAAAEIAASLGQGDVMEIRYVGALLA